MLQMKLILFEKIYLSVCLSVYLSIYLYQADFFFFFFLQFFSVALVHFSDQNWNSQN